VRSISGLCIRAAYKVFWHYRMHSLFRVFLVWRTSWSFFDYHLINFVPVSRLRPVFSTDPLDVLDFDPCIEHLFCAVDVPVKGLFLNSPNVFQLLCRYTPYLVEETREHRFAFLPKTMFVNGDCLLLRASDIAYFDLFVHQYLLCVLYGSYQNLWVALIGKGRYRQLIDDCLDHALFDEVIRRDHAISWEP